MRRRIEIVAFERTRVISSSENIACPVCFSGDGLLTSAQAASLLQVGEASIRRWLARGRAHGFKTPGGQYRVCRRSLS
ncbi:MAG TPA: helix-turn-helix domain-containing protein [Blastocatellia bacterium]|nr:helix-turn-helix domain-containing protein [Blastocatellia bacterium]